jgi:hypothetical protein
VDVDFDDPRDELVAVTCRIHLQSTLYVSYHDHHVLRTRILVIGSSGATSNTVYQSKPRSQKMDAVLEAVAQKIVGGMLQDTADNCLVHLQEFHEASVSM